MSVCNRTAAHNVEWKPAATEAVTTTTTAAAAAAAATISGQPPVSAQRGGSGGCGRACAHHLLLRNKDRLSDRMAPLTSKTVKDFRDMAAQNWHFLCGTSNFMWYLWENSRFMVGHRDIKMSSLKLYYIILGKTLWSERSSQTDQHNWQILDIAGRPYHLPSCKHFPTRIAYLFTYGKK